MRTLYDFGIFCPKSGFGTFIIAKQQKRVGDYVRIISEMIIATGEQASNFPKLCQNHIFQYPSWPALTKKPPNWNSLTLKFQLRNPTLSCCQFRSTQPEDPLKPYYFLRKLTPMKHPPQTMKSTEPCSNLYSDFKFDIADTYGISLGKVGVYFVA